MGSGVLLCFYSIKQSAPTTELDTAALFLYLLTLQNTGYFFGKKALALQESDMIMSAIRKSILGSI